MIRNLDPDAVISDQDKDPGAVIRIQDLSVTRIRYQEHRTVPSVTRVWSSTIPLSQKQGLLFFSINPVRQPYMIHTHYGWREISSAFLPVICLPSRHPSIPSSVDTLSWMRVVLNTVRIRPDPQGHH